MTRAMMHLAKLSGRQQSLIVHDCAHVLAWCLRNGWRKTDLDALEEVYYRYECWRERLAGRIRQVDAGQEAPIMTTEDIKPGAVVSYDMVTVRILAVAEDYAIVRHKGCAPFAIKVKDLVENRSRFALARIMADDATREAS